MNKKDYMIINISGNFAPYKRKLIGTLDRWLWDPFSLVDGIIPQVYDAGGTPLEGGEVILPANQTSRVTFNCGGLPSTFEIEVLSQATKLDVTLINSRDTVSHTINAPYGGTYEFHDFITVGGVNTLVFNPYAEQIVVGINYRELSL